MDEARSLGRLDPRTGAARPDPRTETGFDPRAGVDPRLGARDARTITSEIPAVLQAPPARPANDVKATGQWDPLESTCRHASLSIL